MDINNEYGTRAIQNELLPLLKNFHKYCLENDINYSLAYGSLLGAVRHNGFIPWDDDVDVIVDRDNFDKIRNTIFKYPLMEWNLYSQSSLWVGRIKRTGATGLSGCTPMIDVFVLDNVPDSKVVGKIKLYLLILLQGTIKNKPDLSRFHFLMKVCAYLTWLLGKCLPSKVKYSLYEKVSKWGNKKKTKMISCYNTIYGYMGKSFSSSMISGYSLHPFEDTELFIMNGFDEFLANTYGDYMTPPKDRVGHHLHPEYRYSYK